MNIKILKEPITRVEAIEIGKEFYKEMVKGVVDIQKEIVVIGGEYHVDANEVLMENGSLQSDVWGFNVYLNRPQDAWIEYTSLITIRPLANNRTMTVEDENIRQAMKKIIQKFII